MERIEIAVIGSGPAGISAAITARARNKHVVLMRPHGVSEKVSRTSRILNYPGLSDITGADFAKALDEHLSAMNVEVIEERVAAVYSMGSYFAIQTDTGMREALTVILATGVQQGSDLPGENAFVGRGVSYCATCDAAFFASKPIAVLGYSHDSVEEAEFLAETSSEVLFFPMKKGIPAPVGSNITIVNERPKEIVGTLKVEGVRTESGLHAADGVFVLKDAVAADKLVPGLAMDGAHVQTTMQMETNLAGLFVCGDLAGKPYQYVKAAGQGNVAALSAVSYLAAQKAEA